MSAQRKPEKGDVIFEVQYCPKAHGDKIRAEDETDWPGDHMRAQSFTDFRKAEAFAIERAADDWFGCASVRRNECENPKYDWWDQTGFWEVMPESKPGDLDLENPDQ